MPPRRRRKPPGATTRGGWGHNHQRRRAMLAPYVNAGKATCRRCHDTIHPAAVNLDGGRNPEIYLGNGNWQPLDA